jgi:hypothetical protein
MHDAPSELANVSTTRVRNGVLILYLDYPKLSAKLAANRQSSRME